MRGILLLVLMGLNPISGLAYTKEHYTLNISITNASPNLCTLVKYSLKMGYFDFASNLVAEYIPPYSTTSPIVLDACVGAEIELNYSCGDNKSITFNSKHIPAWFSNQVSAEVLSAQNITAKYRIVDNGYHGAVHWRWEAA